MYSHFTTCFIVAKTYKTLTQRNKQMLCFFVKVFLTPHLQPTIQSYHSVRADFTPHQTLSSVGSLRLSHNTFRSHQPASHNLTEPPHFPAYPTLCLCVFVFLFLFLKHWFQFALPRAPGCVAIHWSLVNPLKGTLLILLHQSSSTNSFSARVRAPCMPPLSPLHCIKLFKLPNTVPLNNIRISFGKDIKKRTKFKEVVQIFYFF